MSGFCSATLLTFLDNFKRDFHWSLIEPRAVSYQRLFNISKLNNFGCHKPEQICDEPMKRSSHLKSILPRRRKVDHAIVVFVFFFIFSWVGLKTIPDKFKRHTRYTRVRENECLWFLRAFFLHGRKGKTEKKTRRGLYVASCIPFIHETASFE